MVAAGPAQRKPWTRCDHMICVYPLPPTRAHAQSATVFTIPRRHTVESHPPGLDVPCSLGGRHAKPKRQPMPADDRSVRESVHSTVGLLSTVRSPSLTSERVVRRDPRVAVGAEPRAQAAPRLADVHRRARLAPHVEAWFWWQRRHPQNRERSDAVRMPHAAAWRRTRSLIHRHCRDLTCERQVIVPCDHSPSFASTPVATQHPGLRPP